MNLRYCFLFFLLTSYSLIWSQAFKPKKVSVTIYTNRLRNNFIPVESLGAAYDGHPKGETDHILTPENIRAMSQTGLHEISYRLRTELGGEVWHWNPEGSWSDKQNKQGYWISDSVVNAPILLSYGYRLPRRGNTHDQANDDDYSRLADGDPDSYWKSNPYLCQSYTGVPDTSHPQWVIIDLGKQVKVNWLKIAWANPYASSFRLDYADNIGNDYFDPYQPGLWHSFPNNISYESKGGEQQLPLAPSPVPLRFVRITLLQSSHTAMNNGQDKRDTLGYAIRELELGLMDHYGFKDYIRHTTNNKRQTVIHVSSTDPWHRATDIDSNTEQTGIDRFFHSGLTNDLPALMPVGLLYDTPGNMAALASYLKKQHYPVNGLEMGEEPEGQLIHPSDYAALYIQWADCIRAVLPSVKMGGPGFAALAFDNEDDDSTFTEAQWTKIFLEYLRLNRHLDVFHFFTTEWYPFDNICAPSAPQLAIAPQMLKNALGAIRKVIQDTIPVYLTEYGYSAYGGKAEVEIEGGLMYADIMGQFLCLGGSKSYLYGYEPTYLEQKNNCTWGNNMLFGMDDNGRIIYRTAAYFCMHMMTHNWAQPAKDTLRIYDAATSVKNRNNEELIMAYALRRPDNTWSIALINKDPVHAYKLKIIMEDGNGEKKSFTKPCELIQYSPKLYTWKEDGSEGHPTKALPPVTRKVASAEGIMLPPYSLTIISQ